MRELVLTFVALCLAGTGRAYGQGVVLPLPPEDSQRINALLGPGTTRSARTVFQSVDKPVLESS